MLVPSWAKDVKIGNKMINARAETVDEKPSFRKAFAGRRGLLPIDGFYEWFETKEIGRSGKPLKQPLFIHRSDGEQLSLAVIYEFWRDKEKTEDDPDWWLTTFSIITTTATDAVGHIHNRMPMAVAEPNWQVWLDPATSAADAKTIMAPPVDELEIYAVACWRRVGVPSVRYSRRLPLLLMLVDGLIQSRQHQAVSRTDHRLSLSGWFGSACAVAEAADDAS